MNDCEFCELRKSEDKIYEDDKVFAVLPIKGANSGEVLLLTKEHYPIIENVPDYIIARMGVLSNKISMAIFEAIKVQGTNIIISNGVAAGQKMPHFSMRVVPRTINDGLNLDWNSKQLTEEEMSTVELKLKEQTKKIGAFEKEKKEPEKLDRKIEKLSKEKEDYLIRQLIRIP